MNWWGKLIGGGLGFLMGGPIGGLFGAAFGHNFDKGLDSLEQHDTEEQSDADWQAGNTERVQAVFFTTTFSVMGYIAKIDGTVDASEINQAQSIMQQMMLNNEQRQVAIKLFSEGKRENFSLEEVIGQFCQECRYRRNLLQIFLEIQINMAFADGILHEKEKQVLVRLTELLGFSSTKYFAHLLKILQAQRNYQSSSYTTENNNIEDAYAVLGINIDASDQELKKAYRRLMSQHHPDKLVAKGLPEEMIKIATEKTQKIRTAYDEISQYRKQNS